MDARPATGAALALVGLLLAGAVAAQAVDDADAPATEQRAEAAVARLGAQRALGVVATTRTVTRSVLAVRGLASGVKASVQDLAAAKRGLDAQESDVEVRIALPSDVLFDVDKADIRRDAAQALAHLGTVIRAYQGPVRLIGHTDSDGSDAHNQDLSIRRAASVQRWLVERERIDAQRLTTEGKGESQPVAPNDTPANKQRNRRVEVIVRKR
jgi:outer membrane protein OmpA-like peptidoglycan-associated protein